MTDELFAGHRRHEVVGDHQIEFPESAGQRQRLVRLAREREAERLQGPGEGRQDGGVVIDDEDLLHATRFGAERVVRYGIVPG